MRVVEVENLKENMIVGKTIFSHNGGILLRKGIMLKQPLIETIKHTDLLAIYIEDEFSRGIEPSDVIDEQFRAKIVQKIKAFFTLPPEKMTFKNMNVINKEMTNILTDIIEQVLSNGDDLVNLVSLKNYDDYTFQHSVNVAVITTVLGVGLEYNKDRLIELVKGAIFHDIGKMFINKEILSKPDRLTDVELFRIKQHPVLGFDFARSMFNLSINSLIGILQHHEKYNGEGYPTSKSGDRIHINAQIIAIADVFDAITSKRPYHEAKMPSEAIEYIMGNAGIHFSKIIVELFLNKIAAYPVGSMVELSNGMKGVVCGNTEGYSLRPLVKLFTTNPDNMYINLASSAFSSIVITKVTI